MRPRVFFKDNKGEAPSTKCQTAGQSSVLWEKVDEITDSMRMTSTLYSGYELEAQKPTVRLGASDITKKVYKDINVAVLDARHSEFIQPKNITWSEAELSELPPFQAGSLLTKSNTYVGDRLQCAIRYPVQLC